MAFPSDSFEENKPIATPEGDNEGLPDEPIAPEDVDLVRPRGDELILRCRSAKRWTDVVEPTNGR